MILIVDDETDAIDPLKQALRNLGLEPAVARDGDEALKELAKNRPDLVFLDLSMPGKSGLDVLSDVEILRYLTLQEGLKWKNIPVITYSSYSLHEFGVPEERGFNLIEHWQKPMTFAQLSSYSQGVLGKLGLLHRRRESDLEIDAPFAIPDQAGDFLGIRDLPEKASLISLPGASKPPK